MNVNPTIFREYDIRGRIDRPDELVPEVVAALGRAFAVFLKRRGIEEAVIGHDARPYSKIAKDETTRALIISGISVIDIGEVLTPIFYFAQYHLKRKGGVMVTASHNELGWSGFKLAYDYSTTFVPQDMAELRGIVESGETVSGKGGVEMYPDIISDYEKDILNRVKLSRPLRVLVDTANGTASPIVPRILRNAGLKVVEQYTEVSEARHHQANPSTLDMLKAMTAGVLAHEVDISLGFDEDGDRLGAVDEKGNIVWPDRILALLARPVLEKETGAKIVFDVKCTEALLEEIQAHGGIPVMWKTGHSHIKAKAKEEDAALAGERSGHFFFRRDYYGFDDAVFASLKLLEYLSGESQPFSEIVASLPQYLTSPVWHAPCDDLRKYEVIDALTKEFKAEYGPEKVIDINGARVYLEDGWGLVRASSNVPALVLVLEAKTEAGLKKIEAIFREKLLRFPEVGKEWTSS